MNEFGGEDNRCGDGGSEIEPDPEGFTRVDVRAGLLWYDEPDAPASKIRQAGIELGPDLSQCHLVIAWSCGLPLGEEFFNMDTIGDFDGDRAHRVEQFPALGQREIDVCDRGPVRVSAHAPDHFFGHRDAQGGEGARAGLVEGCAEDFGVEHPFVLSDGHDADEFDAVVNVEGLAHRAGLFNDDFVIGKIKYADAPDEVFDLFLIVAAMDCKLEPAASFVDFL